MNLIAGFQFLFILTVFGFINYLFMIKRYTKDIKNKKLSQYKKITRLYPKGTFISN